METKKTKNKKNDVLKTVSKAHTRYYNAEGVRLPSSTTITGLLNKPSLVKWANDLGLDGYDSTEYTKAAARIGTLIHGLVEEHITGVAFDRTTYSDYEMEIAQVGYYKYLEWEKGHDVKPIFNEKKLVSEKYQYGGTLDFYCLVDGDESLIDFKSGSGIYGEHFCQTSSYFQLLEENGYKVKQTIILNIGRDESEPLQQATINKETTYKYFEIFLALLRVYYMKKELKWK